jgi:O-antigen ligase
MTLALATATGLLMLYEKRLRIPALLAGMSLAISLVGAYFAVAWVQLRADHLFASLANYGASDYGQLAKAGIAIGMEHPLVGAGVNSFRDLCPELPYQGTMFRGLHPHNIFIEWFAAAGVPGLMLLIVLIGQWVHEAATRLRGVSNAERLISACAIGVVLQHFFPLLGMQSSFANWSAMLTWYPLALMMAALPPRARIR